MINILAFGQVAGVTGSHLTMDEAITDTDHLQQRLQQQYPALVEMKYAVAVDKKIVRENTALTNDVTIALLPPFSGG